VFIYSLLKVLPLTLIIADSVSYLLMVSVVACSGVPRGEFWGFKPPSPVIPKISVESSIA